MPAYSHILFDHDGVLVDTEPLYYQATRQVLATLGVDLAMPEYLSLQAAGGDAWQEARQRGYSAADVARKRDERNALYQELLRSQPIDIDGVEEVLLSLRPHCRMAIVTTAKRADFELIHQRRSITRHMDLILMNGDYPRSKPHPDPYLTALARLGIAADAALVVEDSERGLRAAVAAGIDCAVVHHSFTATQDFSAATYRLRNLRELLELVA